MHVIAVHGGAGNHSIESEKEVLSNLRKACQVGLQGATTLDAVETAIRTLEDAQCLNAGLGSNLTFDGTVECDASLMAHSGHFGAVGALSGVKNPISTARKILDQVTMKAPFGRVHPLLLVSVGAHAFAQRNEQAIVPPDSMVSQRARKEWEFWRNRFEGAAPTAQSPNPSLQDTVGAVSFAVDEAGQPTGAAGVSRDTAEDAGPDW